MDSETLSSIQHLSTQLIDTVSHSVADAQRHLQEEERRLREERAQLEIERREFEESRRLAKKVSNNAVTLERVCVGSRLFEAPRHVFCAEKSSIFVPLLSGDFSVDRTEEGAVVIDRDPTFFPLILRHLYALVSHSSFDPQLSATDTTRLRLEASYYNLSLLDERLDEIQCERWVNASSSEDSPTEIEPLAIEKTHEDLILSLLYWNEHRLFIASADGTFSECNPTSMIHRYRYTSHSNYVTHLAAVDEHHFVSCSRDCTIALWRVPADPGARAVCMHQLVGHKDFVLAAITASDPGVNATELRLISCGQDATMRTWALRKSWLDLSFSFPVGSIPHTPCDEDKTVSLPDVAKSLAYLQGHLFVAYGAGVMVFNVERWVKVLVLDGHTGPIRKIAVCPRHLCVMSGSWDQTVQVHFIEPESFSRSYIEFDSGRALTLAGHGHWVSDVSPFGPFFLSSAGKSLFFFDYNGVQRQVLHLDHTEIIRCLAHNDEYNLVFSGAFDFTVRAMRCNVRNPKSVNLTESAAPGRETDGGVGTGDTDSCRYACTSCGGTLRPEGGS